MTEYLMGFSILKSEPAVSQTGYCRKVGRYSLHNFNHHIRRTEPLRQVRSLFSRNLYFKVRAIHADKIKEMIARRGKRRPSKRAEFLKAFFIIVLIGIVLRVFVVIPYLVDTPDMQNDLYPGDCLLVSQLAYRSEMPKVNDIVVFEHPMKVGTSRVGRIIAVEGQTVEIKGKVVYVNGKQLMNASYTSLSDYRILPAEYSTRDYYGPIQVPSGSVFILCDNRDTGEDSRQFGPVTYANIKGKGLFVYWSWKPDSNSPKWESPYIIPAIEILFYNTIHFTSRVGWDRIGTKPE
jgi:signal peptidase I